MTLLLDQAVNGCALGALYALCGLALWLVLAASGLVQLGLAGAVGLATLAGAGCLAAGTPLLLAVPAAGLAGAAAAVLTELLVFGQLRRFVGPRDGPARDGQGRDGQGDAGGMLAALAAWVLLDRLVALLGGWVHPAVPPRGVPMLLDLGFMQVAGPHLLLFGLLGLAAGGLGWMAARSWLGPALRALGEAPATAVLAGVAPHQVLLLVAGLAGALAGLAGICAGLATGNLASVSGGGLIAKGLVVALVGGLAGGFAPAGVAGVVAAGLALGLLEVACAAAEAFALRDSLGLLLLLALLLSGRPALLRRAGEV